MSNVIKAEHAGEYGDAPVFDLSDIEAQAGAIISAAEARAAQLLNEAEAGCRELADKAAEEGRARGVEEGRKEGLRLGADEAREDAYAKAHDEIAELTATLVKACENFSNAKDGLYQQAQQDLLDLSLLIARKIVAREIDGDAHVTADNLQRCLETLSNRKNLTVRVAPMVVRTVEERLEELSKRMSDLSAVRVMGDEEVSPGGCVISGESGMVDATIETQFAEVERILFGEENA